jgi:hypothetical protein
MIRSELAQMTAGVAVAAILIAFPALAPHAATGSVPAAQQNESARAAEAVDLLRASGYRVFRNFHPAGRQFEAMVTTNGRDRLAIIDPDRRLVTID